jgi:hypothetical protein
MGHGLPAVGAQYVLFLVRSIPNQPEYETIIDSGYELRGGRVYPLDDAAVEYEGTDARALLDKARTAIEGAK